MKSHVDEYGSGGAVRLSPKSIGVTMPPQRLNYMRDLLITLVGRDLKLRYKRSLLGIAWSLLTPLAQLAVFFLTFDVLLPQVVSEAVRPPSTPARTAAALRASILVAEDEHSVRRIVCMHLRRAGYQVVEAANGAVALQLAEQMPHVDLLLTDVVMPIMDGRVLADTLTGLRPDLKVLYMTGYTGHVDIASDVAAHHRRLLHKPFTSSDLLAAVAAVLDEPADPAGS